MHLKRQWRIGNVNKEKMLDVLAYVIRGIIWLIGIGLGLIVLYMIGENLINGLRHIDFSITWEYILDLLILIGKFMIMSLLFCLFIGIWVFSEERIKKIKEKKREDEWLNEK